VSVRVIRGGFFSVSDAGRQDQTAGERPEELHQSDRHRQHRRLGDGGKTAAGEKGDLCAQAHQWKETSTESRPVD